MGRRNIKHCIDESRSEFASIRKESNDVPDFAFGSHVTFGTSNVEGSVVTVRMIESEKELRK